jgi:phosphoadenosine phosphosulfate reductase
MGAAVKIADPPLDWPGLVKPLAEVQSELETRTAAQRVEWALRHLPSEFIVSSSFGIQAAVSLHLITRIVPDIPVVLVDTGYLFPETYGFAGTLSELLRLNLKVFRPAFTPAQFETQYGRLWEQGVAGIQAYNAVMKVEPMRRALDALAVGTWFSGLRRSQGKSRAERPVIEIKNGRYKLYPIIDWSTRDVHEYLKRYGLPYHPLWEAGYVSVGDVHTSSPLRPGMTEADTRFFGLTRECGLHN